MKARVLSAVLAILMILAVCPVIALSAADSTVSVWDGKVAGTDKTLKELQLAYNADPDNYVVIEVTKESIKSDLNVIDAKHSNGSKAWHVHTGAGLAFMSAWSNGYVKFSDWDVSYATAAAAQVIRMTKNIDLNNQPWIPIGAYTGAEAEKFIFSGEGFYISNMNIKETADLATDYRCFGLFGAFITKHSVAQIVNLAVIDATIDVTVNQPATDGKAVYVGGIVGLVTCGAMPFNGNDKVYFNNNVLDANITVTTNGVAEVLTVAGIDGTKYQAAVGGMVGYAENLGNIELNNFLSSGKIEVKKTNATDTPVAAGGLLAASNGTATKLKTNVGVLNMDVIGVTMPDGTVPYYGMTNCNGNGGATIQTFATVWSMAPYMAQNIGEKNPVTYGPTPDKLLADTTPLKGKSWVQPMGAGHFPMPSQFNKNYAVIESSLWNAMFNNLGASVRTAADTTGLRFSVELSAALLTNPAGVAEYGMIILPESFVNGNLVLNSDGTAPSGALKIVAGTVLNKDATAGVNTDLWAFGDTAGQMNVALIKIPQSAADTKLVARPYVKLNDGTYYYGDIMTRSLMGTVNAVMASGSDADKALVYGIYSTWEGFNANGFTPAAPQA